MKTLNETTTGNLFNFIGILASAGDYAGKYQDQAFDILSNYIDDYSCSPNTWADIMHNNKGQCYAIIAEGELTMQGKECYYVAIDKEDCEQAYNEAQTHI